MHHRAPTSIGLHDPPPAPRRLLEQRHFPSAPNARALTTQHVDDARAIALRDARVSRRLESIPHAFMGGALYSSKDPKAASHIQLVFYDYKSNVAVEVHVDPHKKAVERVIEGQFQPAPTKEELKKAIDLAAKDRRIADPIAKDGLEGRAIQVTPPKGHAHAGRRLFDVRFGEPNARLPRLKAMVDIGAEAVLEAGHVCGHEDEEVSR
jgi:hypothetical protein